MSKLLKEAIADAKIVRETAIQNARAILNEAFEPKLKKLINTKLKEELEDDKPEDELGIEKEGDELGTEVGELGSETEVGTVPEPDAENEFAEGEDITGATKETEADSDKFVEKEGENCDELDPEVKEDVDLDAGRMPGAPGDVKEDTNSSILNHNLNTVKLVAYKLKKEFPKLKFTIKNGFIQVNGIDVALVSNFKIQELPNLKNNKYEDPKQQLNPKELENLFRKAIKNNNLNEVQESSEEGIEAGVKENEEEEDGKDFDINEVIKELEDETGIEPNPEDEVHEDESNIESPEHEASETPDEEKQEHEAGVDEDEELEIVPDAEKNEFKEGEEKPEDDEKEVYERIIMKQRSAIREQKKIISTYKNQLHEINLLNAKLLYTNKLFNTFPLSNREKMRVVESFDRTMTVREAKLVFASLHEAFASKTIQEHKIVKAKSTASKVVASTKPSAATEKKINESVESDDSKQMREKFQRLANIKILKS